ncbi:unnamed protein product [Pichia kudriavzevii]
MTPLALNNLPVEILTQILALVDPLTLQSFPLVCKTWYRILQDDQVWREIFKLQYPYSLFSSVSKGSTYRSELAHRSQLRHNFRRGKLLTQQYTINHIITGHVDIAWSSNILTVIDVPRDMAYTCDIRTGKSSKFEVGFVPEGATCFDIGRKMVVFGKWNGSLSCMMINHKGLLIDLKRSTVILAKGGITAFSGDENGKVYGWDTKNGKLVGSYTIRDGVKVSKIKSDGKSVVICVLENFEIYSLSNAFDKLNNPVEVEKVGTILGDTDVNINNIFVDYGTETVTVWDDLHLVIYSYGSKRIVHSLTYDAPLGSTITHVAFESGDKQYIKQDHDIIGGDPLLAAIALSTGYLEIINIREPHSNTILRPIHNHRIIPTFIEEHDSVLNILNSRRSPISSIALNSVVVGIASHLGTVEIFDIMTGEYLRTVIDRIGKKKVQELQQILSTEEINNLIKISLDDTLTRGALIIGPHIQYFLCGQDKHENDTRKFKASKRLNDRKGDTLKDIEFSLDNYRADVLQNAREKKLRAKYNGEVDSEEEVDIALGLSLSLNYDEDEELRKALELSQLAEPLLVTDDEQLMNNAGRLSQNTYSTDPTELALDSDEELRLAIELSMRESYKNYANADEEQWQPL